MKRHDDEVSTLRSKKRLRKFKIIKDLFQRASDIDGYWLDDRSTKRNTKELCLIAKQMDKVRVIYGLMGFKNSN